MQEIKVRIDGTKPLLQHKISVLEQAIIGSKSRKNVGARKDENPEDFLYLLNNKICQPAEHIYNAIVKRAGNYKITGRGKKSYKELVIGALEVKPDMIEHLNQEWVVDERTVVIPATRGRAVRKRPKFEKWALEFSILIHNDDIPTETVKEMLDDAGREGGLGDFRPRFGTFIVTKWEVL